MLHHPRWRVVSVSGCLRPMRIPLWWMHCGCYWLRHCAGRCWPFRVRIDDDDAVVCNEVTPYYWVRRSTTPPSHDERCQSGTLPGLLGDDYRWNSYWQRHSWLGQRIISMKMTAACARVAKSRWTIGFVYFIVPFWDFLLREIRERQLRQSRSTQPTI